MRIFWNLISVDAVVNFVIAHLVFRETGILLLINLILKVRVMRSEGRFDILYM